MIKSTLDLKRNYRQTYQSSMSSIMVQHVIMISVCFFVVMATRPGDSSKLDNNHVYYPNTDGDTDDLLEKYFDYFNEIVFRDKLLHSLIGRGVPDYELMKKRDPVDDSLARKMALGHNSDAFNSLTSNKREDERIDNFQTQQDDASEIPKKFNDPLVLDKASHTREANNTNDTAYNSRTYSSDHALLRNQHRANTTYTNEGLSVHKRPFSRRPIETCTLDSIYINIQFEEHIRTQDGSNLLLTCTDGVTVNKCEGSCHSSVKPTLTSADGYTKTCSCCKDSSARTRSVTLSMCTLGNEEVHGYELTRTLLEPTSCSCQPCRN